MSTEERKLHIIDAVLRTDNNAVLEAMESIVDDNIPIISGIKTGSKFSDLLGSISLEEAAAMKQVIKDNFEKIDPNDWQ